MPVPAFLSQIILVLSAVILLNACSGGGGGSAPEIPLTPPPITSTPPPVNSVPPAEVEISGNAHLGKIINGIVTILDISGIVLANSVTDNSGNYGPVTLPASHTGPIVIEITPAIDGSSFFICDFPSSCCSPPRREERR